MSMTKLCIVMADGLELIFRDIDKDESREINYESDDLRENEIISELQFGDEKFFLRRNNVRNIIEFLKNTLRLGRK